MPRLSLGVSTNSGSNRAAVAPAPSGIVAATAGNLIITFAGGSNETYIKINNAYWSFDFDEGQKRLTWNNFIPNAWALDENLGNYVAENPQAVSTLIPTSGWVYTTNSGLAITITAA